VPPIPENGSSDEQQIKRPLDPPRTAASDPRLHFGLGVATTADIEIHWPLGLVEKYPALAAGQLVTIREGVGIVKGRPFRKS
jgi:hypothetical protein